MADADRMRDRLRALGRAAQQPPPPELEARIVERVAAFGPGVIRRSRQRQAALRVGAIALPIALCAAWIGSRGVNGAKPDDDSRPRAQAASSKPALPVPAANVESATATATVAAPCATQPSTTTDFSALPGGRRWIDLGDRGRIVLEAGGEANLDAADPCKLELQLAAGRVSVHAANLWGGELKVHAGTADVVVHGTTFAVERTRDRVTVDVDEGAVAVASAGRKAPLLRAGESLRLIGTQAPVLLAFSNESRQQLRAALATVTVAAPDPRPTANRSVSVSAKLVARADKLWLEGDRTQARARYREAGAASGPTAEAAWLALARRELSSGDPDAARTALTSYAARFPSGELAAEAAGIELRAALAKHDLVRADRIARKLVERYPGTPQGEAAARWRREHGARR